MAVDSDLQFTDDGYPIGEVVVATGGTAPHYPPLEARMEENREELLRKDAMDLTGETSADTAILDLYPRYDDLDARRTAMNMFIIDHLTVQEISERTGVPGRTISQWAYIFRWEDLVKRELVVQHAQSVLDLARLRNSKRLEVTREQLDQAKKIRDRAVKAIETGDVSLKSGAEAWSAAARIEHTLTGVSEAGSVTDVEGRQEGENGGNGNGDGKTPLVLVFPHGGLPPVRKSASQEAINV